MRHDAPEARPADQDAADRERATFYELLRRTHLSAPSDVAAVVADEARSLGTSDVVIHLVDYALETLVPLPAGDAPAGDALSVSGTVAGRAFATTDILRTPGDRPGEERLWVPLLDGTERLGVIGLSFDGPVDDELLTTVERYAHLVAMLIVTKSAYGDVFEQARRREPMTLASELLWSLAPPLVFATDRLVIAGMLEPAYDNGGDALDYAVNAGVLHLAVFDAMGHGLAAAGVAAFAVAAYRHSRRAGASLLETYEEMDEAVGNRFPEDRFVTALIAQLDLDAGRLRFISAGHPPPLLIRGGRRAWTLDVDPSPPLGVHIAAPPAVASESLEPGDLLLLYTDGLTEARDGSGRLLGIEGLSGFIEREAASGRSTPEMLRRLRQAIIASGRASLRDDATALLAEWRRGGERLLPPQTVLR